MMLYTSPTLVCNSTGPDCRVRTAFASGAVDPGSVLRHVIFKTFNLRGRCNFLTWRQGEAQQLHSRPALL